MGKIKLNPFTGELQEERVMENVQYGELVRLRDRALLIPGQQYRIIDYKTTDKRGNVAGHDFDIVVSALSANALSEFASAMPRQGDSYFANNNLAAWKIKYCLDNDLKRFDWVDPDSLIGPTISKHVYVLDESKSIDYYGQKYYAFVNGDKTVYSTSKTPQQGNASFLWQEDYFEGWVMNYGESFGEYKDYYTGFGVIYYLRDEFGNEASYDFKNILISPKIDDSACRIFKKNKYYTFSKTMDDESIVDASLSFEISENRIKQRKENGRILVNNIIVNCTEDLPECVGNVFETNCHDIVTAGTIMNNHFGSGCYDIVLQGSCADNTWKNQCYNITLSPGCERNMFYEKAHDIVIDMLCADNIFHSQSFDIELGSMSLRNTFMAAAYSHKLGKGCCDNFYGSYSHGIGFQNIIDGNKSQIADYCKENYFSAGVGNILFSFSNQYPSALMPARNINVVSGNYGDDTTVVNDIALNSQDVITVSPKTGKSISGTANVDYGVGVVVPRTEDSAKSILYHNERGTLRWQTITDFVKDIKIATFKGIVDKEVVFVNPGGVYPEIFDVVYMSKYQKFAALYASVFDGQLTYQYFEDWSTFEDYMYTTNTSTGSASPRTDTIFLCGAKKYKFNYQSKTLELL